MKDESGKTYDFPLNGWLDDEQDPEHLSRELDVATLPLRGRCSTSCSRGGSFEGVTLSANVTPPVP